MECTLRLRLRRDAASLRQRALICQRIFEDYFPPYVSGLRCYTTLAGSYRLLEPKRAGLRIMQQACHSI